VTLKLDKNGPKPSKDLGIGMRWDPIVLDPPPVLPAAPADESPSPVAPRAPVAPQEPDAASVPDGAPPPTADAPATEVASLAPALTSDQQPDSQPSPAAKPEPDLSSDAPEIVLISPEAPGSVVQVAEVKVGKSAITADLVTPAEPGLYRLVLSLHDGDGVAFDLPRQDPIPDFTVRVTGSLSAAVSASGRRTVVAGSMFSLPVAVANTGSLAWGTDPSLAPADSRPAAPAPGEGYSQVVGRWMRLGGPDGDAASPSARAMVQPSPGETGSATLTFQAPAQPGTYLLVLDVVSPLYGSLTAVGGEPMTVRVLVTAAPGAAGADPATTADQGGSTPASR
jgi:hypothetical protein